jgi:hypothetical protein
MRVDGIGKRLGTSLAQRSASNRADDHGLHRGFCFVFFAKEAVCSVQWPGFLFSSIGEGHTLATVSSQGNHHSLSGFGTVGGGVGHEDGAVVASACDILDGIEVGVHHK